MVTINLDSISTIIAGIFVVIGLAISGAIAEFGKDMYHKYKHHGKKLIEKVKT